MSDAAFTNYRDKRHPKETLSHTHTQTQPKTAFVKATGNPGCLIYYAYNYIITLRDVYDTDYYRPKFNFKC